MAGTKTWADGDVITFTDLNGFVRDQWITICTSGTRPTTTQNGRHIYETDTARLLVWDGAAWALRSGGAWTQYTPTWTGSVSNPALGDGYLGGGYQIMSKTMHIKLYLYVGSTTTFGSGNWIFSLPSGIATVNYGVQIINGYAVDISASATFATAWEFQTSAVGASVRPLGGVFGLVTPTVPFTWAVGDYLLLNGTLEIA